MNDTVALHPHAGVSPSRRALVRSAAWATPVIIVGAAAPAFALSPCASVPYPTGWVAASPASGTLASGDTNGYTTGYAANGANCWLSVKDNSSTAISSNTANDATCTLQTTLTLVAGRTYTFSFTVASQHGNSNASVAQLQLLEIQLGGASVGKYTTQSAAPAGTTDPIKASRASGYTLLATPATAIGTQTITLSYNATAASTLIRYLWTMPARGYNPLVVVGTPLSTYAGGSDDIAISAPTITGAGC